jgi:hypothetical protein
MHRFAVPTIWADFGRCVFGSTADMDGFRNDVSLARPDDMDGFLVMHCWPTADVDGFCDDASLVREW